MALLWPIVMLGVFINLAVFLVLWNLRGRGFRELVPRRNSSAPPNPVPGGGETPARR